MGITARVFRSVQTHHADGTATLLDCTNNGWSSHFKSVCVINVPGPAISSIERPAVVLRMHQSKNVLAVHAVLEEHDHSGKWTMMGGNFLYCSDSRFGEFIRDMLVYRAIESGMARSAAHAAFDNYYPGAVAIHDRIE